MDMLLSGDFAPHNYLINGIEYIKDGYSSILIDTMGKYYSISMRVDDHEIFDHFTFSIVNIKKNEKQIKGKLSEITFKQEGRKKGIFHDIGEANGSVKLDLKSNIVIMEVIFFSEKHSEINYKIIWENDEYKNITKEFVKLGKEINFHVDNIEEFYEMGYNENDVEHFKEHKWQFHIFPLGGLRLLDKKTIAISGVLTDTIIADAENRLYVDGGVFESKEIDDAEKHSVHNEVYLSFKAEKVGKYRLIIDNGFLQYNYDIYVL
jgi:hypothetical protein